MAELPRSASAMDGASKRFVRAVERPVARKRRKAK
jgi:hypothetical protein